MNENSNNKNYVEMIKCCNIGNVTDKYEKFMNAMKEIYMRFHFDKLPHA